MPAGAPRTEEGRRSLARVAASFVFGRLIPHGLPLPILRGPLKGIRFVFGAAAGDGGGASIYMGSSEPEQTRVMTETLRAGQVAFDVGANVGYYTLLASRLVGAGGRVVAFEPFLRNFSFLARHVHMNRLENVLLMPYALSNAKGMVGFKLGRNNAVGCLAGVGGERDAADRVAGSTPIAVPSTTIDDFVADHGLRPDVIKIDVEGAELLVLEGARDTLESCEPTLFLSTHTSELRQECLGFLARARYQVSPIGGASLETASEFLAVRGTGHPPALRLSGPLP